MNINSIVCRNKRFENCHVGKRCFILANGPSTNNQDLRPLNDEITIAVNKIHKHKLIKEISPDYWTCVDPLFFKEYTDHLMPIFNAVEKMEIEVDMFLPINYIDIQKMIPMSIYIKPHFFLLDGKKNLDKRLDFSTSIPNYTQNVVIVAMMIALYLGCNPIYLVGFDHTMWGFTRENFENDAMLLKHSYAEKSSPVVSKNYSYDFIKSTVYVHMYHYHKILEYAQKRGFHIYNATEGGYLNIFERVRYEELFPKNTLRSSVVSKNYNANKIECSPLKFAESAIDLMSKNDWASAMILIDTAIAQNIHKESSIKGLSYLKSLCFLNLGEYGSAEKAAYEDYLTNPSNREKSSALLDILRGYSSV